MSSAAVSGAPADMRAYGLLAIGVLSVGAAAVVVRLAGTPALALAFWRTLIGGLTLLALTVLSRRRLPQGAQLAQALVAGALLGGHFWLWLRSLELTSVAASVVLVCLQPVFVTVLAALVLGERPSRRVVSGIGVALLGTACIALDAGGAAGAHALGGDALALAGAVAIAGYVLVGRRSAGRVDVLAYSATVSLAAAASLAVPTALSGAPLPPSATSWVWTVALALGPQVIGHTALNAALARLPATVVSGSILGEPIIATALAWAVLGEVPGPMTLAGSAVVMTGLVLLVVRARPHVEGAAVGP